MQDLSAREEPRLVKSITDNDAPKRLNDRMDRDAPKFEKSMTDRDEERRENPRSDNEAPRLAYPSSDIDDPSLHMLRMDRHEPKFTKLAIENFPLTSPFPPTKRSVKVVRPVWRQVSMAHSAKTERLLPQIIRQLTDSVLPMRCIPRSDNEEPSIKKSKTESEAPRRP